MISSVINRHRLGKDRAAAVARVVSRMKNRLHEPLTLTELARTEHFSPFHFHRVFRETTTTTPARFLAALRMAEARRLLVHSQLTVTEVSTRVGYHSTGTFTTQFTRLVGVPPERFRRLARSLPDRPVADLLPAAGGAARPPRGAGTLVRPQNGARRALLCLVYHPAGDDGQQDARWAFGPGGEPPPLDAVPGGVEYEASVVAIDPAATPTEALVDHAEGSRLIGSVRFRSPANEQSGLQVPVPLRRPRPIDPPALSVVPVRWLVELAQELRHPTARLQHHDAVAQRILSPAS
ncbi:AraC family transcriptional regulator [Micromonospora sp. NPDC126480]|uniref:AraC family transcriptional regulator n=1 Tax=Micromonospora sp. NPDC126480 TaxID=3155312 RepID=UPI00331C8D4F